jgi:hypothetical protein
MKPKTYPLLKHTTMEKFETLLPAITQRAESSQPFIGSITIEASLKEMKQEQIQ